uniref:Transmembrane protein 272-like n=1 Tax=Strigamia maritima TaxID=126957 RepID=T1J3Z8_STRMM
MAATNTDLENLYQQQEDSSTFQSSTTPPPLYGDIPGVVPFRQGGAFGPPPTYEEANDPNLPPPTYDSLYGKVREARKNSSGLADFLKKLLILILGTLGCSVIIGMTVIIPMSMIIIGSMYLHNCPAEPYIPIYLIVGGAFGSLKNLMSCGSRYRRDDTDENHLRQNPVDMIINCFLFAWFITGCVWVYKIYEPEYDATKENYCNKILYLFSFWLLTSVFILVGLFGACICCVGISAMLFMPDN